MAELVQPGGLRTRVAHPSSTTSSTSYTANMPGLDLKTNVKVADPKAFCVEFSKVIVVILSSPCVSY